MWHITGFTEFQGYFTLLLTVLGNQALLYGFTAKAVLGMNDGKEKEKCYLIGDKAGFLSIALAFFNFSGNSNVCLAHCFCNNENR